MEDKEKGMMEYWNNGRLAGGQEGFFEARPDDPVMKNHEDKYLMMAFLYLSKSAKFL